MLANAWDAASAKILERAGSAAIATSSAAVAWAHGYADGHHLPVAKLVETVAGIARIVSVPVSVDAEGGYAETPEDAAENIARLIGAGAVGINIEDGRQPHLLHCRKIEAIRSRAMAEGVDLFINARTDVYLARLVPAEEAVAETLRRAAGLRNAGASGLFAPLVTSRADIAAIVEGAGLLVNVLAFRGVPDRTALAALGVRRPSAGTAIAQVALRAIAEAGTAFLDAGQSDALLARTGAPMDVNAMFL